MPPAPVSGRPPAWAYAWWALVGVLLGFGVVAILTVGALFVALGAVLAFLGGRAPVLRTRAAVAAVAGFGVAPLYLAWLNRGGPGQVCTQTADQTSCLEAWSPWPFLAVAVLLVGAGVWLLVRQVGRPRSPLDPPRAV